MPPSTKERFEAIEKHSDQTDIRLDGIDARLENIDRSLGIRSANSESHSFWPKTLAGWSTVVGAAITIIAVICGATLYLGRLMVDGRIRTFTDPLTVQVGQMNVSTKEIQDTLNEWKPFMAPEILKHSSSLKPEEFEKSLGRVNKALQAVSAANAKIPSEAVPALAQKFLQVPPESSSEYWPTVLRFVQLASLSVVSSKDVPPPGPTNVTIRNIQASGPVFGIIAHKIVELDGGSLTDERFENDRIIFTEHPVEMRNVTFVNCIFEMPEIANPGPYLQNAARQLMTSNLSSVTLNLNL
jgi:hypothetical protein